jgi:hypothetical protein
MTSSATIRRCLAAALCLLTPLFSLAQNLLRGEHYRVFHFEVPGSNATYPLAINEAGTITGYFITASGATSGFVRYDEGQITTFAVPGSIVTEPVSINTAGDITGFYELSSASGPIVQGFIRSANGIITTVGNTAQTGDSASFWAQPVAINTAGEVVGNYPDVSYAAVDFIRSATGSIGAFTLSAGASYSTFVSALNDAGEIVGYTTSDMFDASQGFMANIHGPLPDSFNGTTTEISVPGSEGTFPTAINAGQTVVGCSFANNLYQDFVRNPDGSMAALNLPGTTPSCLPAFSALGVFNVNPTSITINDQGIITGYYINQNKVPRGFVRYGNGRVVTFGQPEATQTIPTGINNGGVITGYDSNGSVTRGFICDPLPQTEQ